MRTETIPGWTRKVLGAACGLALAGGAAVAASAAAVDAADAPPVPSPTQTASLGAAAAEAPRSGKGGGLIAVLPGSAEQPDTTTLLADPDLAAAFSTSAEGLFEEELPDGSVMVRLQGRFQSVLVATVAPGGAVQTSHRPLALPLSAFEWHREPPACRPAPSGKEAGHAQN